MVDGYKDHGLLATDEIA